MSARASNRVTVILPSFVPCRFPRVIAVLMSFLWIVHAIAVHARHPMAHRRKSASPTPWLIAMLAVSGDGPIVVLLFGLDFKSCLETVPLLTWSLLLWCGGIAGAPPKIADLGRRS